MMLIHSTSILLSVCLFILSLCQSNTVLHLDMITGAVRRLMLSPDSEQPSTSASNWWSSKEQQVRGFSVSREHLIWFVALRKHF